MNDFTRKMIKDLCANDCTITRAQVNAALDVLSGKVPIDRKPAAKECHAQLAKESNAQLVTFKRAAEMIGCSPRTVRRLVHEGLIKTVCLRARNRIVTSSVYEYTAHGAPGVVCGKKVA